MFCVWRTAVSFPEAGFVFQLHSFSAPRRKLGLHREIIELTLTSSQKGRAMSPQTPNVSSTLPTEGRKHSLCSLCLMSPPRETCVLLLLSQEHTLRHTCMHTHTHCRGLLKTAQSSVLLGQCVWDTASVQNTKVPTATIIFSSWHIGCSQS